MMAADTSAIVAVLTNESDAPDLLAAMEQDGEVLVSVGSAVELMTVAIGKGGDVYQLATQFLQRSFVHLTPLDEEQLWVAADAYRRYGKGQGHPAQLNFGDTFAYALASVRRLPLLFKGNDFSHTDVTPAV